MNGQSNLWFLCLVNKPEHDIFECENFFIEIKGYQVASIPRRGYVISVNIVMSHGFISINVVLRAYYKHNMP